MRWPSHSNHGASAQATTLAFTDVWREKKQTCTWVKETGSSSKDSLPPRVWGGTLSATVVEGQGPAGQAGEGVPPAGGCSSLDA